MIIINWKALLLFILGVSSLTMASLYISYRLDPWWGGVWFIGNLTLGWLLSSEEEED